MSGALSTPRMVKDHVSGGGAGAGGMVLCQTRTLPLLRRVWSEQDMVGNLSLYEVHLGCLFRGRRDQKLPFQSGQMTRNRVAKGGCCGPAEMIKFHAYKLTEYHRVVHLDTDALVRRSLLSSCSVRCQPRVRASSLLCNVTAIDQLRGGVRSRHP